MSNIIVAKQNVSGVDHDETFSYETSHLDLNYLQSILFWFVELEGLKRIP